MRADHHTATDVPPARGSTDILALAERELPDGLPVGELVVATRVGWRPFAPGDEPHDDALDETRTACTGHQSPPLREGEALLTERKKHVNDFLRDGAAHGTEIPGGGEGHADDTQRHTTHRALEGDESHAAADVHENGVRIVRIPSLSRNASTARLHFRSRSQINTHPFARTPSFAFANSRIACTTKASSGYRVEPATWTRRDCNSMTNTV